MGMDSDSAVIGASGHAPVALTTFPLTVSKERPDPRAAESTVHVPEVAHVGP